MAALSKSLIMVSNGHHETVEVNLRKDVVSGCSYPESLEAGSFMSSHEVIFSAIMIFRPTPTQQEMGKRSNKKENDKKAKQENPKISRNEDHLHTVARP